MVCEDDLGEQCEAVVKFTHGCEEGTVHLVREAIAACLAGDLELPIPEPMLVDVPKTWTSAIPDGKVRAKVQASNPVAFGSRFWSAWLRDTIITDALLPIAAAVFAFDGIIQNPDRRWGNPNCLVKGDRIRIFDHDLAFAHERVIGWKPPWVLGGLGFLAPPGHHIFKAGLSKERIDWKPVRSAWQKVTEARLDGYVSALPREWANAAAAANSAVDLIRNAVRDIDGCLAELEWVLK
jgi:hypothetical protein